MAETAPAFDVCGVRVAHDPVKGKVVFSERTFRPGQVIFSELAFVAAPWSTDLCGGCEELRSSSATASSNPLVSPRHRCHCERTGAPKIMYSPRLHDNVGRRNVVVGIMKTIDGIEEIDRARCILKCLAMYECDPHALDGMMDLTCVGQQRVTNATLQLRRQLPDIFPAGFTDQQMATLIGVLNTNSHELENLGGSGLFLSACRMEHNCKPNCSFTTFDSTLWMTAIRPIAPGDALSIDYGNFFYRPTPERQECLLESYGFICTCEACVSLPDPTRAVRCLSRNCPQGVMLPCPARTNTASSSIQPKKMQFEWRCQTCGTTADTAEHSRIFAAEQELLENGFPESLEEVDAVVSRGVLHESHYLLFWALDNIGCEAAITTAFRADAQMAQDRRVLAQIWERIITYMNVVVPTAHHEKTIYYDNLAQVQVVLGNLGAASQAYARAYEVSCLVSGTDCSPTRKLQRLMEKPPQTAEDLRQHYAAEAQHRRRPASEADDEDMEE
ncbi:uncharacterized protein PITG_10898 [Phytophthora infestans T30-4]|uniref:SET domain-containing protein n=2 Tax=Phytophthora infestans TaxID=4787 RepID=D0NHC7_PHYIT|nr:uncharacterized protein PITG_10898 [Phytophthora infestans T30-4]EEY58766.1 conserved hypothetical protein [Phytophthora infestans T30-4]KAF4036862.1 SET domain-containing protein [Phytophthora infestans]KAF4145438.1 SET domain-containing protein [Phytophthora infestans]KAI9986129.1 hypothetical protein PInf_025040 [Phytophthora infestans]|eukprot:XP_002901710.1 conserved hypothetical protein [Phytophthora infestans T30-4]